MTLIFDTPDSGTFEVVAEDNAGTGEVYIKAMDVFAPMAGWKFKDWWGNEFEVVVNPSPFGDFSAILQVWAPRTIARIDRPRKQTA